MFYKAESIIFAEIFILILVGIYVILAFATQSYVAIVYCPDKTAPYYKKELKLSCQNNKNFETAYINFKNAENVSFQKLKDHILTALQISILGSQLSKKYEIKKFVTDFPTLPN